MINKLRAMLGGCEHKWNVIEVFDNIDSAASRRYGRDVIVGKIYHQQCESCGKIRKVVV